MNESAAVGEVASTDDAPPSTSDSGSRAPLLERNARLALIVFIVVEVVAVGLYLWLGRGQWFFLDDWDFLANRELTSVDDLLRPHNEHWSAVGIVLYRAAWNVVGIKAYWPYQLLAIINHLAIAALLRVVMRRAGVAPWIATVVAGTFVLFGSGDQSILGAFQVVFAGAMAFGLTQLLLADHDGPFDRRDWFGLLAGLAAIMSAGLGVTMVVVVGIATLLKRGWRIAAFHTVPLAAAYIWWFFAYGREAIPPGNSGIELTGRFVLEAFEHTFRGLAMLPGTAWLLGAVLVVGLGLAWHRINRPEVRRLAANPFALLVGSVAFLAVVGWGRAWIYGAEFASQSRYLHAAAALLLPALAVAINAIYQRWRIVGMGACALLLLGVPGNIRHSVNYEERNRISLGQPDLFLAMAHSPTIDEIPRDVRPLPETAAEITAGWLADGVRAGKIPPPEVHPDATVTAVIGFRLSLRQIDAPTTAENCRPLTSTVERQLQEGDYIDMSGGPVQVFSNDPSVPKAFFITYYPLVGERLVVVADRVSLRLMSVTPLLPGSLCE